MGLRQPRALQQDKNTGEGGFRRWWALICKMKIRVIWFKFKKKPTPCNLCRVAIYRKDSRKVLKIANQGFYFGLQPTEYSDRYLKWKAAIFLNSFPYSKWPKPSRLINNHSNITHVGLLLLTLHSGLSDIWYPAFVVMKNTIKLEWNQIMVVFLTMEDEMKYQMEKMPVRCQKYLCNDQKK